MKRVIYTVRITGCSNKDLYWYFNKIGKEFECEKVENESMFWPCAEKFVTIQHVAIMQFKGPQPERGNILPQDCQVIAEREEEIQPHTMN